MLRASVKKLAPQLVMSPWMTGAGALGLRRTKRRHRLCAFKSSVFFPALVAA
jgi:hypothetical protein